jgi:protein HOOK3
MSSDSLRKETDAFVSFFSAFELPRTIATIVDLSDGAPLLQVLTQVYVFNISPFPDILIPYFSDSEYFRQPNRPSPQLSENWVLRFSALKRLYRLLTQYFSDVLNQFTSSLEVPDLQAMAKDSNVKATLIMCRLTIAIAVQCDNNKLIIEKIQGLSEINQHYLMKAIEQVSLDRLAGFHLILM